MLAIYKREMRMYFTTPIGYIFIAVFLAATGFLFGMTTLQSQTSDVSTYCLLLMFSYIILIPLLTMKTFCEERRTRTEQMLLTAPVSLTGMVMAKYFSALTMFVSTFLVSLVYSVPLLLYGEVNWARTFGSLFAILLIGMTFIAVGVFISSLTENQFVAAFGTIGVLFAFLVISLINDWISFYPLRALFSWLSVYSRFGAFMAGKFDIAALVYYLSIMSVFLFLSVRVFEKRRWS